MKRYFLFLLSVVLFMSAMAVPVLATEKYDYKPFSLIMYYGSKDISKANKITYTFDQAATGYMITDRNVMEAGEKPDYVLSGEIFEYPCIILKDNSNITIDNPSGMVYWGAPEGYSTVFSEVVLWGTDEDGAIHNWTGHSPLVTSGKVEQLFDDAGGPALVCARGNWDDTPRIFVLESQVKYFNIHAEKSKKRDGISLSIYDKGDGEALGYTAVNQGSENVNGYYALLSYWPETIYYAPTEISPVETEVFYGQILPLDIALAPGESVSGECWAIAVGWSTMTHKWIKFDSKAERDSFFEDSVLKNDLGVYVIDKGAEGVKWMEDTFGIAIQSGKN